MANAQLKLLFMTVGDADGLITSNKALHDDFIARGVVHTWQVEPGIGHETVMWQRGLYNFAPLLFKGINAACGSTTQNGNPICCDTASDPDGDGWGMENNKSCVIASLQTTSSSSVKSTSSSSSIKSSAASSLISSSVALSSSPANSQAAPAGKKTGGSIDLLLFFAFGLLLVTIFCRRER